MSDSAITVDQRNAAPLGDNVGRDKIVHQHERRTQLDGWLDKLADEMRDNPNVKGFVDSLQYYLQKQPHDDIVGLEAKLDHAGRGAQIKLALRRKEAFSKFLAEWQAYPSAQEIIAYFLSKIDAEFELIIVPMLSGKTTQEIDTAFKQRLIDPVLQEMGCGPFMLNYMHVSGMVYWLAEQCYIRWHA